VLARASWAARPRSWYSLAVPLTHDRSLEQSPDARLVALIAEPGDGARAEAELCRRYQRRIQLYALRHLRDEAAAADMTQDALVTVLQRIRAGEIREADKLGSFVLGTCRMLAANRMRGEARRSRLLAQYADPREAVAGGEPLGVRQELERVSHCLGALPDRERTVLLLSFYGELDAQAIGRELGTSSGNVRVIRHRALASLQTCVRTGLAEDVP
jgi:RNA polymerase sigma-70 factor (ECF subfamily)